MKTTLLSFLRPCCPHSLIISRHALYKLFKGGPQYSQLLIRSATLLTHEQFYRCFRTISIKVNNTLKGWEPILIWRHIYHNRFIFACAIPLIHTADHPIIAIFTSWPILEYPLLCNVKYQELSNLYSTICLSCPIYMTKAYLINWANPLTFLPRGKFFGYDQKGLEARTRLLEILTLCLETLSPLKGCLKCKNMLHKLAKLQKLTWKSFICCLLLLYERTTNNINNDGQWSPKLTMGHNSWDINMSE